MESQLSLEKRINDKTFLDHFLWKNEISWKCRILRCFLTFLKISPKSVENAEKMHFF
jgi:hypothetical protein